MWFKVYFAVLILPDIMEQVEFMICTAACHQRVIKVLCLHFEDLSCCLLLYAISGFNWWSWGEKMTTGSVFSLLTRPGWSQQSRWKVLRRGAVGNPPWGQNQHETIHLLFGWAWISMTMIISNSVADRHSDHFAIVHSVVASLLMCNQCRFQIEGHTQTHKQSEFLSRKLIGFNFERSLSPLWIFIGSGPMTGLLYERRFWRTKRFPPENSLQHPLTCCGLHTVCPHRAEKTEIPARTGKLRQSQTVNTRAWTPWHRAKKPIQTDCSVLRVRFQHIARWQE